MKTKFLLLCLLAISPLCKADFLPVNLKVNGLVNPMGIDGSPVKVCGLGIDLH